MLPGECERGEGWWGLSVVQWPFHAYDEHGEQIRPWLQPMPRGREQALVAGTARTRQRKLHSAESGEWVAAAGSAPLILVAVSLLLVVPQTLLLQ